MKKVYPVVLSGGSELDCGLLKKMFPKQFLPFDDKGSLFTKTLKDLKGGISIKLLLYQIIFIDF